MSEGLSYSDNPLSGDRRLGPRQHASSIMYVKLGEHNGGVILNLGEGGLAVQAAMVLKGDSLALSFQLSAKKWLQTNAQIVWSRQRTAGLRFNDLSETTRIAIREWLGFTEDQPSKAVEEEANQHVVDLMPHDRIEHTESNEAALEPTTRSLLGAAPSPDSDELPTKLIGHKSLARTKAVSPRLVRRSRQPSRLAIAFVLGCVIFFAGLVAVRTIVVDIGHALASGKFAGNTGDSTSPPTSGDAHGSPIALPTGASPEAPDFNQRAFDTDLKPPTIEEASLPSYEPPAIIERVEPRYSADARARRLEGTVRIRALIGSDGSPSELACVSGDPILAQIAMDAISLWRYQPARIDDDPVVSEVIIPIRFQMTE